MNLRRSLYGLAGLAAGLAGLLLALGKTWQDVLQDVFWYLGPLYSAGFMAVSVYAWWAFGRWRLGDVTPARLHVGNAISLFRELGLAGTLIGILVAVSSLATVELANPYAMMQAFPRVIQGLVLALGTTLVGRVCAQICSSTGAFLFVQEHRRAAAAPDETPVVS